MYVCIVLGLMLRGLQHKIVQKCESGLIFIEFQAENARGVVLFDSRPKRAETARGVTKKGARRKKNLTVQEKVTVQRIDPRNELQPCPPQK